MLIDLLHNIFSAGSGSAHPSVAVAATYAMSVGVKVEVDGGTPQEIADAYKYAFGGALGWTQTETDMYWSNHAKDPYMFTDESIDAYDTYVHSVRRMFHDQPR